jgi:hypothetical protein
VGFVVDKAAQGVDFLRVLLFPCHLFNITLNIIHHAGWYNRPNNRLRDLRICHNDMSEGAISVTGHCRFLSNTEGQYLDQLSIRMK